MPHCQAPTEFLRVGRGVAGIDDNYNSSAIGIAQCCSTKLGGVHWRLDSGWMDRLGAGVGVHREGQSIVRPPSIFVNDIR